MKNLKKTLLNDFISILASNNIHIEFEETSNVENFLNQVGNAFLSQKIYEIMISGVNCITSEMDVSTKKTVETSCLMNINDLLISEYSSLAYRQIPTLKKLFNQQTVLDIQSQTAIYWSENKLFNYSNYQGIEYQLTTPSEHNVRVFTNDEYTNYFNSCNILNLVEDKELFLYSLRFSHSHSNPVEHRFAIKIDDNLTDKLDMYLNYVNMSNILNLLKDIFDSDIITIMLSSLSNNFVSIEFRVPNQEFKSYINLIKKYGCLDEKLSKNLTEVTVPNFVDYMTFKFQWKDKSHQSLCLTAVTENKETIKNILDPD